jgi:hypothetical protein
MPNPELRERIRAIIHAPDETAMHAALDALGPDLLSEETDAEMAAWSAELQPAPDAARLDGLRADLRPIRAAMAEGPDAMVFGALMAVRNTEEMEELVSLMTDDSLAEMIEVADRRLAAARLDPDEAVRDLAEAIADRVQALRELRDIRAELDDDPVARALQDYLLVESDEEARGILLADPAVMLDAEIGRALASWDLADPVVHARMESRRALWRQIHGERNVTAAGRPNGPTRWNSPRHSGLDSRSGNER